MRDSFIGQVALDDTLPIWAICRNGSGVPTTPDGTPTFQVFRADDPSAHIVEGTLNSSDQATLTGFRTGSQSITEALGFAQGDLFLVVISYEISSTTYLDTQRFIVG